MNYIDESFDNIFYEDDIIETKLTEEDMKNLEKIRDNIMKSEYTEEIKDSIYYTIKDYYEEAIERGFRFDENQSRSGDIDILFKTTEHNQTSLFCDKDDCEETEYYIGLSTYYAGKDFCNIKYIEDIVKHITTENTRRLINLKSYYVSINKSNNSIKYFINGGIDKKELNDIIKRIKFNFNIK